MKSDRSLPEPPKFSRGGGEPSRVSTKSEQSVPSDPELSSTEPALQRNPLIEETGDLNQDSYQPVDDVLHSVLERHRTSMKNRS
ncbi:hypothetical protein MHYP_G00018840 [Metynnis hypsauchen]